MFNKITLVLLAVLFVAFASPVYADWRLTPNDEITYDTDTLTIQSPAFDFNIGGTNKDSWTVMTLGRTNRNASTVGLQGTVSVYPDTSAATPSATITMNGTTGAVTATTVNATTLNATGVTTLSGDVNATDTLTVTGATTV